MTFEELLDQAIDLLQRRGRLTYRALKRQFGLDDAVLEDLKEELIYGQRLAVDEEERVLVWIGTPAAPPPGSGGATPSDTSQVRAPLAYTPPHLAEKILTSRSALEGERKQVTVLFADLKGSMELLADRDPEEARQLLDPVLECMMAAVHRYEGTVNQVMGDGIMALFGAPLAHEDHAVRACYAALAMQAAVQQYAATVQRTHGVPLQMRVGLNAGEVVVRAIGNDLHMDYSAIGQTTHLAARMEQIAMPGSILLTPAVLGLTQGYVHVKPLGPVPVKGLETPVEVYELVGTSGVRRRLQATALRGLTRFVGRDIELAALVQALERAAAGHGQVVAVVGEAGVGKSRLVYECVHAHHAQGWRVLESTAVSYGKATPYFPLIDLLKRYVHVEDADEPHTIREKVTGQVLTLDETLQETIPALLWLLDILPDDSPFRTLDPPQRRQRLLDALKRVLIRESQVQPLLLVCEDLHWIDTETQALLDRLVDSLPTARLLLLVNYRPEYQHGWSNKTYYTQLRLDALPPTSADEVLQALLGDGGGAPQAAPLQALKHLLIARTEGNPFFLEESVRALVETGVLVGVPGAYRLAQTVDSLQVPATVQTVLAARIDRLPHEAKHLLQTAAVIGTEVPLPLLQAIADVPEAALHSGLAQLQAAEFLYETRLFPEHEYTFKHALTHEVAYGSLLLERRRVLHARIVPALEALAGDRLAEQVDQLAHHALRGAVWDKAVTYYRQVGARAVDRSALREAAAAFEQALVALQQLPDSRATREQAIDLRLALRHALLPLGEFGRLLDHLRQAEPLAEALGDTRRLVLLARYRASCVANLGDPDGCLAAAQRALALATALEDVGLRVAATNSLADVYWQLSDYRRAAEAFRQTVELMHDAPQRERFGTAAIQSVYARAHLARCLAELGDFVEGRGYGADALRLAETFAHPYSLAQACGAVGLFYLLQGALPQAVQVLERGLAVSETAHLLPSMRALTGRLGAAYALAGRIDEGLPLLKRALEQTVAMRQPINYAPFAVWLGEGYVLAGRLAEAHQLGQQALEKARILKQQGHQVYALRLLGDIATRRDPQESEPAAAHYRQALALAEELGMRPLQAHCHLGLGTLYVKTGFPEPARAALTTAVTLYRTMEMTFWLPQAEAALAQVEGR